ncbi:DUF4179 domain-containing protein [Bacillus alkalisoli]|uniref:DUF4179 domain-containing protein n=1 Tax=Bacillus alkalisoli TaxID=2011008 RepID=UPI0012FF3DF6|nr:DUF4179 domain-containing protein [Bacillus alkalisoli]
MKHDIEKDIKKMFEDIPIPKEKLNATVQESLSTITMNKKYKERKKQRWMVSIASIFVIGLVSILLQVFISEQNQAEKEEQPNSIFLQTGDAGLVKMVKDGKVKKFNLTATHEHVKVTLEEAFYDKNRLAVSYKVESNSEMKEDIQFSWRIDGTLINQNTVLEHKWNIEPNKSYSSIIEIDPNQVSGNKIELVMHSSKDLTRTWSFQFELEQDSEYISFTPVKKMVNQFSNFELIMAKVSPSIIKVEAELVVVNKEKIDMNKLDYSLAVTGIDHEGVEVKTEYIQLSASLIRSKRNLIDGEYKWVETIHLQGKFEPMDYVQVLKIVPYLHEKQNTLDEFLIEVNR